MTVTRVELAHGGALHIRYERVGRDSLHALSARVKMEALLPDYADFAGLRYQIDFADLLVQCEGTEGIGYDFPDWRQPGEELAQAFERWLDLPDKRVQDTRAALTPPEGYSLNAPDLLPASQVPEAVKKDPLPSSVEQPSLQKSTES